MTRITADALAKALKTNPDLKAQTAPEPRHELAARFETYWQVLKGPELTQEFRFHPERRWRADYAHEASRTLIELEGGVYSGGRHTRAAGYIKDAEKYNNATADGWAVFRLCTGFRFADVELIFKAMKRRGA